MKKLLYLFLILPLAFYAREVFSSAYNQGLGTYSTRGPASQFMQNNNTRLRNETCDYNQSLPSQFENLKRTPPQSGESITNPVPWGLQENKKQQIQQNTPSSKSDNSLQIERETPRWWRQEGSYQGWGFD